MPSATEALNRDSIAASSAMVKAGAVSAPRAEDVFNLRGKDYHGDAGGEPCGDREWNKADERPHAAEPKDDEEEARHQCADQQAGCVVLLQDAHDDDHEGSGGAAYLIFASAEQGDEEPGHNGGDEALGWGESACDGKGHGQRNGYYTDGQSRKKVRQKGLFGISFERGEKSRFEHGCRDGWPAAVVAAAGGVEASPSCTRRRPRGDGRQALFVPVRLRRRRYLERMPSQ